MERKYTDRNGTLITAAQFLTELFLIRRAAINREILPVKFWDMPEHRKAYQITIIHVSRFLKTNNEDDVVNAFLCNEGKRLCSIKNPKLFKLVEKFKIEREKLSKMPEPTYNITDGQMRNPQRKSIIFDLREIE